MKKRHILIMMMAMLVLLCACGGKNEPTMLDETIQAYSDSSDGSEKIQVKKSSKVKISKETIDLLKEHKDEVIKMLSDSGVIETDGQYKGQVSDEAKSEMKTTLASSVDEMIAGITDDKVLINTSMNDGSIMLTIEEDRIKDYADTINEIGTMMGVYQNLNDSANPWTVIINIYTYKKDGSTRKYGSIGMTDTNAFSARKITKYQ